MDEEGIEQSKIRADHLQWRLPYLEAVFPLVPGRCPEDLLPDRVLAETHCDESELWGVIVETRQHPALERVIQSILDACHVAVQLFHGTDNLEFILRSGLAHHVQEGRLVLTPLATADLQQFDYNRLLLSPRFWRACLGRRKLLVFQTDSMCCEASDFTINDFMGFDYVGSSWHRKRPVGLIIDGGSGGFSLRDYGKTIACLEWFPSEHWPGGEDGYFAFYLSIMGARVATMTEAEQFSTQDAFRARSFGCHQVNLLNATEKRAFLDFCPDALNVFPQLGTSPSHYPDPVLEGSMFTSHKYKLIFFEVPRTGSRSVTARLTKLDPESPTVAIREESGGGAGYHFDTGETLKFPDYFLVAAHRNPYARLWSFWKRRKHGGNPEIFRSISWPRYIDWVCDPLSVPEISGALIDIPITDMIEVSTVDLWLDFHRLDQSWQALCRQFAMPSESLAQLNQSIDHGDMYAAYSPEMAARVAERFLQDFEYFGYDPDSWKREVPLGSTP